MTEESLEKLLNVLREKEQEIYVIGEMYNTLILNAEEASSSINIGSERNLPIVEEYTKSVNENINEVSYEPKTPKKGFFRRLFEWFLNRRFEDMSEMDKELFEILLQREISFYDADEPEVNELAKRIYGPELQIDEDFKYAHPEHKAIVEKVRSNLDPWFVDKSVKDPLYANIKVNLDKILKMQELEKETDLHSVLEKSGLPVKETVDKHNICVEGRALLSKGLSREDVRNELYKNGWSKSLLGIVFSRTRRISEVISDFTEK